MEALKLFEV